MNGSLIAALQTIADFPCAAQDNMPAANMRKIARDALDSFRQHHEQAEGAQGEREMREAFEQARDCDGLDFIDGEYWLRPIPECPDELASVNPDWWLWKEAWKQSRAALAQPSPAFAKPSLLKDCDVRYAANAASTAVNPSAPLPGCVAAQPSPAPELPAEDELEAAGLGYPLSKEEAVKLWYSGFRSEVITVLEAWEAIGHDIGMNPDKGELLASLRYMLEKCEAHDAAQARVAELEKQEPFYYFADCDDPDYSRLYNTEGDALSQISDHGGDVVKLYAAPVAPDVALPPMPTDAMLKAYREVSPSWLCLDGWRAMMEVVPVAQAGHVPEGCLLVTTDQVERHSTTAWECPPQSRVVLLSTLQRLTKKNMTETPQPTKGE